MNGHANDSLQLHQRDQRRTEQNWETFTYLASLTLMDDSYSANIINNILTGGHCPGEMSIISLDFQTRMIRLEMVCGTST